MAFKELKKSPSAPTSDTRNIAYAFRVAFYDKKNKSLQIVVAEKTREFLGWEFGMRVAVLFDPKEKRIMLKPAPDSATGVWRMVRRAKVTAGRQHGVISVSLRDEETMDICRQICPVECRHEHVDVDSSGAVLLNLARE